MLTQFPRKVVQRNALEPRVVAAYHTAIARYAGKSWVTGVTISMKVKSGRIDLDYGPVIAIHVARKVKKGLPASRRIPKRIGGVPTDVIAAPYHSTQGTGVVAPIPVGQPLRAGASLARAKGTAGTLGGVVRAAGSLYLLTAAHVLREHKPFKKGEPLVHPGPSDAGGAARIVARFHRFHLGLDAGLALLEATETAENITCVGAHAIGTPIETTIGDVLEKCGRTTCVTQAQVIGLGMVAGVSPAMHLGPVSGSTLATPISERGDSGAVWYDAVTGRAKGLHVAGSGGTNGDRWAAAAQLPSVMTAFGVNWV